jgi:hypothetical protein
VTPSYQDTMRHGAAQYADVIRALNEAGLPSEFTQTGGMCAAILVKLEDGRTLLITDAEDTLSWDRQDHDGWGVGLYAQCDSDDLPALYQQTAPSDLGSLLNLIREVLESHVSRATSSH